MLAMTRSESSISIRAQRTSTGRTSRLSNPAFIPSTKLLRTVSAERKSQLKIGCLVYTPNKAVILRRWVS